MKLKKDFRIKQFYTTLVFLLLTLPYGYSQKIYYQDIFYGGVTGAGFSTGISYSGSGTFEIFIEPGSTIKKAFLFCNRFGSSPSTEIILNSISYRFDISNQIGKNYNTPDFTPIDSSAVHAIEITDNIIPSQLLYNITIPPQNNINFTRYGAVYLLIIYENSSLPKIGISVLLNEKDAVFSVDYNIVELNKINNNNPVGFVVHTDILWDTIADGSFIYLDTNLLGLIGGKDAVD